MHDTRLTKSAQASYKFSSAGLGTLAQGCVHAPCCAWAHLLKLASTHRAARGHTCSRLRCPFTQTHALTHLSTLSVQRIRDNKYFTQPRSRQCEPSLKMIKRQSDRQTLGSQRHPFELFSCDRKSDNPSKNTILLDAVIPDN